MKSWIALILCVVMLVSMTAVFADNNTANSEGIINYVSFGDSIASGLGLPDYYEADGSPRHNVRIEGSFPALFADSIGASNPAYLANPGFRPNELAMVLCDDYYGDFITYSVMASMAQLDAAELPAWIAENRPVYQNAVKNADVITINLGSNNVMMRMMVALFKIAWGMDMEAMFTGMDSEPTGLAANECWKKMKSLLESADSEDDLMTNVLALLDTVEQTTGAVDTILSAVNTAVQEFQTYFSKCIDRIYELNEDATIIVVGLYNPLRDSKLFSGGSLSVGKIVDPVIRSMNSYMEFGDSHASDENYIYVDAWNAEIIKTINLDEIDVNDPSFFTKISSYIHPNENGHKYMAEQILDAYNEQTLPFSDVDRYTKEFDSIAYGYHHGYLIGTSAHTFAPNMNISRGMFAATLYAFAGKPSVSVRTTFKDVKSNAYYSRGVAWLYSQGITTGVNYSLFAPLASVRTQEMVQMLYLYAKSPKTKTDLSEYSDAKKVSLYAKKAMTWAAENNIIDVSDGTLDPLKYVTRAELAHALAFLAQYQD